MNTPNLDRMWETFVRIGPNAAIDERLHIFRLRNLIAPILMELRDDQLVDWYCGLIHGRDEGVPTVLGDTVAFWHIRFSIVEGIEPSRVKRRLPDEFEMTQSMPRDSPLAPAQAVPSEVRDAAAVRKWWILGEQFELQLGRLNNLQPEASWPHVRRELRHFAHYFQNMSGLPDYESLYNRLMGEYVALNDAHERLRQAYQ